YPLRENGRLPPWRKFAENTPCGTTCHVYTIDMYSMADRLGLGWTFMATGCIIMSDACDLRFDFVEFTARRLGMTRQALQTEVAIHAAATAATTHGHAKQERRDVRQEPHQRRPRQKRLVCA